MLCRLTRCLNFSVACLLACILSSVPVFGQERTKTEISGTIKAFDGRAFQISDRNGNVMVADVAVVRRLPDGGLVGDIPSAEFKINGKKSSDVFAVGQTVRFEAVVERGRKIDAEIKDFDLFSPSEFEQLGFAEPKVNFADPEDVAKKAEEAKMRAGDDTFHRYLVAGTISRVRKGSIIIVVPTDDDEQKINVKISKDALVNIDLNVQLRGLVPFCKKGNKIKASGETILGRFFATKVTITLPIEKHIAEALKKKQEKELAIEAAKKAKEQADAMREKLEIKEKASEPNLISRPPFEYTPPVHKNRRPRGTDGRAINVN